MKQLVFHVGAHRTATTFLQRTFKRNATALAEQGVTYVPMDPDVAKAIDPHKPGAADTADVARWLAALWSEDAPTVLMSWEAMIGLPYQGAGLYGGRRHFLAILAKAAVVAGRELSTVLTFRRQDDFLNSYYGLMIKAGYDVTPDEFKDKFDWAALGWRPVYSSLAEIGSCTAVPFELCRVSTKDYVKELLAPTGIDGSNLAIDETPINEGIGKVTLTLMAYLNKHANMDSSARAGFRKLATTLLSDDGKLDIFGPTDRATIVERCAESNRYILDAFNAPRAIRDYYLNETTHEARPTSTRSLSQLFARIRGNSADRL